MISVINLVYNHSYHEVKLMKSRKLGFQDANFNEIKLLLLHCKFKGVKTTLKKESCDCSPELYLC
jgi:hypothetical protein